jgi:hypothetical protein
VRVHNLDLIFALNMTSNPKKIKTIGRRFHAQLNPISYLGRPAPAPHLRLAGWCGIIGRWITRLPS